MLHMMLLILALSWDSFLVGLVDGCFDFSRPSRRYLLIMFGLCDGGALGIGLFAATQPLVCLGRLAEVWWLVPWLLLVFAALQRLNLWPSRELRWLMYLLPILLSVDNLLAGPALSQLRMSSVLCIASAATMSAALFVAGAACGQGLRCHARRFNHAAN